MLSRVPASIKLHRKSRMLEVGYADGARYELSCEYLRVFSPSAEVHGHGLEEPVLIAGKRNVNVERVEPVGQYAVRLVFDDGHNTGLYTWDVLEELGRNREKNWARYEQRLAELKMSRESDVVKLAALQPKKWAPK
jgi:DUF971 family protein